MKNKRTVIWEQACKAAPQGQAVTLLYINEQNTLVMVGSNGHGSNLAAHELPIGLREMGKGVLENFPPTGVALERAIEVLEDHIMPLAKALPKASTLVLAVQTAHYFREEVMKNAQPLNRTDTVFEMSIDAVEDIFRRLAEVAEGGAPSVRGLPADMDFVATTLVVREFMHHLGFNRMLVLS